MVWELGSRMLFQLSSSQTSCVKLRQQRSQRDITTMPLLPKKVRSKNLFLPSLKKSFPAKPLSNVNYGVTTTPTTAVSSGKHSKQVTATDSGHSQTTIINTNTNMTPTPPPTTIILIVTLMLITRTMAMNTTKIRHNHTILEKQSKSLKASLASMHRKDEGVTIPMLRRLNIIGTNVHCKSIANITLLIIVHIINIIV